MLEHALHAQKQPPANTAVSLRPAPGARSSSGGGNDTGGRAPGEETKREPQRSECEHEDASSAKEGEGPLHGISPARWLSRKVKDSPRRGEHPGCRHASDGTPFGERRYWTFEPFFSAILILGRVASG